MTAITTLLFDLDGTLIDSVPDLALALNNTLQDNGLPTYSESTVRNWVGNGARVLLKRGLSGSTKISDNIAAQNSYVDTLLVQFLAHYNKTVCSASTLYDGVHQTLITLKESGYTLGLVTNKPQDFIQPILTHYLLDNVFGVTVGGDTLKQKKPDAAPLLYACEKLNAEPQNCVMVGDSKNDILAAKAANMRSIGLTYGYNYGEDIGLCEPRWVCNHFNDILDVLKTN